MTTDIYTPQPYYGYQYGPNDPMRTCVRDLQALEALRADLHAEFPNDYDQPLYLFQGAFHDGDLSAETHLGSGVYDLHPSDFEAKARLGAARGIIVFHRLFNWNGKGGGEHCHIIIRGSQKMNPAARTQIGEWDRHEDGLADGQRYDGPWFPVKTVPYHAHPKGQQGAGDDPWGTIALTAQMGAANNALAAVNADVAAMLAKHPNAPEWQTLHDESVAAHAAAEERHARAFHLSHKGT